MASVAVMVLVYGGDPWSSPFLHPASLLAVSPLPAPVNLTAAINRGNSGSSLAWQHRCLIPPLPFGGTRLTADASLRGREGGRGGRCLFQKGRECLSHLFFNGKTHFGCALSAIIVTMFSIVRNTLRLDNYPKLLLLSTK